MTSEIIEVIFKTHWAVTKEFIGTSFVFLFVFLFIGLVFIMWLRLRLARIQTQQKILLFFVSLLLIFPAIAANKKRYNTMISRVPFSLINATKEYYLTLKNSQLERKVIGEDAYCTNEDSVIVVLVLGESLRNDHLSFNGYDKCTSPLLEKRRIYSFNKNRSLHTYTAASIPQILTRADSMNLQRAYNEESIISLFKRVGYNTVWLANQVPDYTYAALAKGSDIYLNLNAQNSDYSDALSTDQNILNVVDQHINGINYKKKFLILHTLGSHWYYNYRCPLDMRIFYPIINSRSFVDNSSEQMINSYDNTVYFTDYFIDEIISKLEGKNSILIYVSDHGESLGEDGKWLHATNHESLYNAACFIWMSDRYIRRYGLNPHQNTSKRTNTSSIFHTLLQAGGIQSNILEMNKSLLSDDFCQY
ncbi:phosphoethanolamine transferase [Saccharicrinis aurantiacus]|uniref:phosphoethanolamine transferase n=1 Tax=Saccharicrinis aurantiacus TaxID=1849719 RepID=UPI001C9E80E8|nr:phosphoethanolamine transferase [Saccharicrinis aurantiacus]